MLSYYRSNNWQCDHCPVGSARLFSIFMDDLVENVGFVCLCTQMWNPTEFQLPPINNKVPRTKTARLFQHCKPSHCVKSNNWPLCTAAEGIKSLLKLKFIQIWNVFALFKKRPEGVKQTEALSWQKSRQIWRNRNRSIIAAKIRMHSKRVDAIVFITRPIWPSKHLKMWQGLSKQTDNSPALI